VHCLARTAFWMRPGLRDFQIHYVRQSPVDRCSFLTKPLQACGPSAKLADKKRHMSLALSLFVATKTLGYQVVERDDVKQDICLASYYIDQREPTISSQVKRPRNVPNRDSDVSSIVTGFQMLSIPVTYCACLVPQEHEKLDDCISSLSPHT
jgi:hypothetical protein